MQPPGADTSWKGRGCVYLNNWPAKYVPVKTRHLGNMAILMGDRTCWAKLDAVDQNAVQSPVVGNGRLFGNKLDATALRECRLFSPASTR